MNSLVCWLRVHAVVFHQGVLRICVFHEPYILSMDSIQFLLLLLSITLTISRVSSENRGRGFGGNIDWKTLDDGLALAKESNKPLMLIIHKSWCGACKALKPKFASSLAIETMSNEFVMVNVEDDEEPTDRQFTPDGGYIPRILFLSPDGKVQTELKNKLGNPKYHYYYSDANQGNGPINARRSIFFQRQECRRAIKRDLQASRSSDHTS
ncbi:Thioredoxin domain-containing protein 12 [Holothuria leucospilota]|uniref:Thioredoxin domain-containing protein 12 n=1 Tax=Holothuria leucospilota TaxID=206669 RepID=A0A9Q1C7L3_HOLLE|nr:Thioredoxin domain-containing protein 12 [Holothuria leucospilota]